jgi:hypothetical protein
MAESKQKACYSPKIFTTHPKHGKRRPNKKPNIKETLQKSIPFSIEKELGVDGLFDGKMTHLSFDCPEKLRKELVKEVKSNGDSVCKILVRAGAYYLINSRIKKHALGDTLSKVIDNNFIGEMNFTQNVQERPRRYMRHVVPVSMRGEQVLCEIGGGSCLEVAVGKAEYLPRKKIYNLCKKHFDCYVNNSGDWRSF